MGVFTTIERTLGLSISTKLEHIKSKVDEGKELDKEELDYLLNQTARFDTLENRLRKDEYKVSDKYEIEEYELKLLVGDIITELRKLRLTDVEDNVYRVKLGHINMLGRKRLEIEEVIKNIKGGVVKVRLLQENFDKNEDGYKVVGTFDSIEKDYGFKVEITVEDKEEDVLKYVKENIKEVLEKEREELDRQLEKVSK